MKITKDLTVEQVLAAKEDAGKILAKYGAHCLGCPKTGISTVESMAQGHEADLNTVIKELNKLPDKN